MHGVCKELSERRLMINSGFWDPDRPGSREVVILQIVFSRNTCFKTVCFKMGIPASAYSLFSYLLGRNVPPVTGSVSSMLSSLPGVRSAYGVLYP